MASAPTSASASTRSTRSVNRRLPTTSIIINAGTGQSIVSGLLSPLAQGSSRNNLDEEEEDGNPSLSLTLDHADSTRLMLEEEVNGGDGGDSDVEGEEFELHNEAAVDNYADSVQVEDKDLRGMLKGFVKLTATGSTDAIGHLKVIGEGGAESVVTNDSTHALGGMRFGSGKKEIKISRPPADWNAPKVEDKRGEPKFEDVDNPGDWPRYCFKPVFGGRSKTTKYQHHALPTGAIPVPADDDGKRLKNGWEFHYKGWQNPDRPYRCGATTSNLFPEEMDGALDADVLKKLGLDEFRMENADALFFFQLVLPLCDPTKFRNC